MTDDDYELWSPKKGEIYPEGYQIRSVSGWIDGICTGREVLQDLTHTKYRRPKTKPTKQQETVTMDVPEGYELWSPKTGEVYPQGYLYGEDSRWLTGLRPKRKPEIKADPNPPQLTMDRAFITKRPQWSDLLDLSLITYELDNHICALADQDTSGAVLVHVEALDQLIDLLRKTADGILFTDHKETSDVK